MSENTTRRRLSAALAAAALAASPASLPGCASDPGTAWLREQMVELFSD